MAPDRTIARRQIEGSKKDKTRLTFVFAANADGSHKMEPLIIGHAQRPRAFNRKSGELGFLLSQQCKSLDDWTHFQGMATKDGSTNARC